jgi:hypothetical protein
MTPNEQGFVQLWNFITVSPLQKLNLKSKVDVMNKSPPAFRQAGFVADK